MRSFLLPGVATGVSLLAVWCLSGATARGPPWTSAVTLLHECDGLSARRMAVLWTFRESSLGRHVCRELMRNVWLDFTLKSSRNYLPPQKLHARYSRCSATGQKYMGVRDTTSANENQSGV